MPTAVLVHGGCSSPADWCWVADQLRNRDIQVVMPDLPSHRHREAHRADDVREVDQAIRSASPPVVVAAWSYGGGVITELAQGEGISRFIYIGSFPQPLEYFSFVPKPPEEDPTYPTSLPHLLFPDEATVVIDDDWWLGSEEVAGFPEVVRRHLREHRRRPQAKSAFLEHFLEPQRGEAWRLVPTTILIGRSDLGHYTEQEQQWVRSNFNDLRVVEGDHFLLWLQPELVADVIAETFAAPR